MRTGKRRTKKARGGNVPPRRTSTRRDLDRMAREGCKHCSCGREGAVLYLHAPCHMRSGLAVVYKDGVLTLHCWVCSTVHHEIKVKP